MTTCVQTLGWDAGWQKLLESRLAVEKKQWQHGRVVLVYNDFYRVFTDSGERLVKVAGRLKMRSRRADLPVVGDWTLLERDKDYIQAVLPRRTKFSRKVAGKHIVEQVVAANIDCLLVMTSCNADFNIRRLERYALLAAEGGIRPVILLSKTDLCAPEDVEIYLAQARTAAVDVLCCSSVTGQGVDVVGNYLRAGVTCAIVGSSGVGKSTLINKLIGSERQKTGAIRETDDRGRHSTTHRELIVLPSGGVIIDTPGMRELQLWGDGAGIADAFDDVRAIAGGCRFADCRHENEPDCAVLAAVGDGKLDEERYLGFVKLNGEQLSLQKTRRLKK